MRAYGIEEAFITGSVDDFDKFQAFMHMLPYAIVNDVSLVCIRIKTLF